MSYSSLIFTIITNNIYRQYNTNKQYNTVMYSVGCRMYSAKQCSHIVIVLWRHDMSSIRIFIFMWPVMVFPSQHSVLCLCVFPTIAVPLPIVTIIFKVTSFKDKIPKKRTFQGCKRFWTADCVFSAF